MFHTIWLKIIDFIYLLKDVLDLTSPWRVVVLILDIAIKNNMKQDDIPNKVFNLSLFYDTIIT